MADLTITPADVAAVLGPAVIKYAGEAITAGEAVYIDLTTSKLMRASADALVTAEAAGIAMNSGALGQPIVYQSYGTITIGATLATGTAYYVSATAGGICLESDIATGDYPTLLGFAVSTTVLSVSIVKSGIAKA